jgi:hypothetical protein
LKKLSSRPARGLRGIDGGLIDDLILAQRINCIYGMAEWFNVGVSSRLSFSIYCSTSSSSAVKRACLQ